MSLSPPVKIAIAGDYSFIGSGFTRIIQDEYQDEVHFVDESSNVKELLDSVALIALI